MKGKVPYSSLRIVNIRLVPEELVFREEDYDRKESIIKVVTCLKERGIISQNIKIEAETRNKNLKKNELQTKVFLPLFRAAHAYNIKS